MPNFKQIFSILDKTHPETMLEQLGREGYTPFQLMIATLLSARTKDSTTIPIVKTLFEKYPSPKELSKVDIKVLTKLLYGVGFHNVKSNNVKKLSQIISEKYHSKIPNTLDELTSLPGVGRKTANCILNYAFNKPAIAVDIHVHRISNRLGWVKTKSPPETELELMKVVPKSEWVNVNKYLVGHGQTICKPIGPLCGECGIRKYCDYPLVHQK
jgi:endonuclease III